MKDFKQVFSFPRTEEAPSEARKAVRQKVVDWGFAPESADTVELLVSELATNMVLHAHGSTSCVVICQVQQDMLTVTVVDHGRGVPKARGSSETAVDGRGLFLVDQLSDDWGVRQVLRGKATYFKLKLPSRATSELEQKAVVAVVKEALHGESAWHHPGSAHSVGSRRRGVVLPAVRPAW